jgi:hypothetical protein
LRGDLLSLDVLPLDLGWKLEILISDTFLVLPLEVDLDFDLLSLEFLLSAVVLLLGLR